MIAVLKNNDEVIVWCSKGEKMNILKIKSIAKTIKRIHRDRETPCKIIIRAIEDIQFNSSGEHFFERIIASTAFLNNNISITQEPAF